MPELVYLHKENVLRFPRLDTVLMVESFIKEHEAQFISLLTPSNELGLSIHAKFGEFVFMASKIQKNPEGVLRQYLEFQKQHPKSQ